MVWYCLPSFRRAMCDQATEDARLLTIDIPADARPRQEPDPMVNPIPTRTESAT